MTPLQRPTFRLLLLVLAITAGGPLLAQQPAAPTGNGFISGQVIEGGTTRAVPGATVALVSVTARAPAREIIADSQGRYVFSGLPAGEFRLTASKAGWRPGAYGLAIPVEGISSLAGAFTLAAGERGRADVPVWRNALIRGRVTDDGGEPLAGARVRAMYWMAGRGHRILGAGGDWGIADDRGEFTMSVRPGEYMLAASSEQVRIVNGRPHVFRQMFFPRSVTTSGAAAIALKSGEERSGIAIQLALEPAFRITGVVNAVDPGRMPRLQLLTDEENAQQLPLRTPEPQGRFVFDNVPAGRYILRSVASRLGPQEPSQNPELWVQAEIEVSDRDLNLLVAAHRPLQVSGRVRFEGTSGEGASIGVRLFRDDELPLSDVSPGFTPTRADGTFTIAVTPGKYVVSSFGGISAGRGTPAGGTGVRNWNLRDATSGGNRDAADLPFAVTGDVSGVELTMTDAATTLRGRVTSRQGTVDASLVLAFPVEERFWEFAGGRRIAVRRASADGTFELRNLPEGNYFLAAVRGGPNEYEARNPALFQALAGSARRVTVLDGQTVTQDVELVAAPASNVARLSTLPRIDAAERAIVRDAPPPASAAWATISGTVVAAGSNTPIGGARVGITPGVGGAPNAGGAYTDSQGRFSLAEVPAGQHTLYVTRPPYVSTMYGAATPADPGTPLTVAGGQRLSDLKIAMLKGAAISGTVTDQNGQPLANVQIGIRAYRWTSRGRELVPPRAPTIFGPATTDGVGQYRAYGLAPGDYVVQASVQGFSTAMPLTTQADVDAATKGSTSPTAVRAPVPVVYTPMFFPNTPDPSAAQTIRLRPGDEMAIDFQFRLMPTATVSGVVRTVDGSPFNRISVNLSQNDPLGPPVPRSRLGSADSSGAFTITGVPPGRYLVTTSQFSSGSASLAGGRELFVDRDVTGVVLDVVPTSTVTGTVRGESIAQLRQPAVRVSLSPLPGTVVAPNTSRAATIDPDDRFSIPNVPPGRYRFELTGPANIVKPRTASQRVKGVETVDSGLVVKGAETIDVDVELVMSEATVGGRLRDRGGQPLANVYVVLFAKDADSWTPPSRRIFGGRPDQNGRYLFPDVPAGDYLVTTLGGVEAGEWFDPAVLAKLAPAASPVTVRRGNQLEIDLETR